jgi:hypothetical protein
MEQQVDNLTDDTRAEQLEIYVNRARQVEEQIVSNPSRRQYEDYLRRFRVWLRQYYPDVIDDSKDTLLESFNHLQLTENIVRQYLGYYLFLDTDDAGSGTGGQVKEIMNIYQTQKMIIMTICTENQL